MITKLFAGCPKFKCNLRHSRNYEHKFYGKINANVLWIRIPPNIPKTKTQFNYESNRPTTSSLTRPIFPFLLTQTLRKSFLKSAFDFPTLPPSSLIDKHFCLCKRHTHAIIVLHHRRYVLSKGLLFSKKWNNPGLFFCFFVGLFQTNSTIFTINQCEKMSIQYMAPGFETTTSQTWVVTHYH